MARLGVVRFSLSFPDTLRRSSFFVSLSTSPRSSLKRRELSLERRVSLPMRAARLHLVLSKETHWLSQVPELPLWIHAPIFDPGGVPATRHNAVGTAAFRFFNTVGFPFDIFRGISC